MAVKDGKRWNHNIHYHPRILRAVPDGAKRALDIGCGEGMLARALRQAVPQVTGIDLDAAGIGQAREYPDDVDYILGDFLTHPFEPASFDVIASVATLHHMDAATGLARMRDLLRPGGVLAIVGLARSTMPNDLPRDLAGIVVGTVHRAAKGLWQHPSPTVWPPPVTYPQMRALATEILPGSQYRRHLLLRYSIIWRKKPVAEGTLPRLLQRPITE
ncbi:class I SAM-dependent methyltransferase [Nonomuraea sp. NPDC049141]|uniref:class I SAM-dependent methyltransferase n=1 Tax=Nonomuraea sp. NPDC049141 TaxID=3155500 RepID=UPI00340E6F1B